MSDYLHSPLLTTRAFGQCIKQAYGSTQIFGLGRTGLTVDVSQAGGHLIVLCLLGNIPMTTLVSFSSWE